MGAQEVLESTIEAYEVLEAQSRATLVSWAGVLSKLNSQAHPYLDKRTAKSMNKILKLDKVQIC